MQLSTFSCNTIVIIILHVCLDYVIGMRIEVMSMLLLFLMKGLKGSVVHEQGLVNLTEHHRFLRP